MRLYRGFPKLGVPYWGPHNKDYSILGSILGSPYFGKLPYRDNGKMETIYWGYTGRMAKKMETTFWGFGFRD